jgi:hypothetical protein
MDTVSTALVGALGGIATQLISTIGAVLPVVVPVLGAIAVIGIGIKVFRKLTGRGTA